MLMMWNENKSIRALKTETKMLRWGNNCCREDCTHFLFYSFPLCVIFFAASLLSVSDVLVFQVAFLMLFVNLLNKKKKKKLIFLDAWGNSLIPDKLPRKSLKWLSLPQRQGCKNWKGFHFWLFQLLQKETFASVWSLKTVTEQIKITKISICDPPTSSFSALLCHRVLIRQGMYGVLSSRGCQEGHATDTQQLRAFTENIHKYWCWKTPYSADLDAPSLRITEKRKGTWNEWKGVGEARLLGCCYLSCPVTYTSLEPFHGVWG